jgi:hypothetical protein
VSTSVLEKVLVFTFALKRCPCSPPFLKRCSCSLGTKMLRLAKQEVETLSARMGSYPCVFKVWEVPAEQEVGTLLSARLGFYLKRVRSLRRES